MTPRLYFTGASRGTFAGPSDDATLYIGIAMGVISFLLVATGLFLGKEETADAKRVKRLFHNHGKNAVLKTIPQNCSLPDWSKNAH